jgi:pimeloyl-ACP methyl ester carboxylesterase
MNHRGVWLKKIKLLLFVFLGVFFWTLFFFASPVHAEHCTYYQTKASGYFFDTYESADYDNGGYLTIHLKLKTPYNDGRKWTLSYGALNDENCLAGLANEYIHRKEIQLTPGIQFFSIRFSSLTDYAIWNDEENTLETCINCSGVLPPLTEHYEIAFNGYRPEISNTFQTASYHILEHPSPLPTFSEDLQTPDTCTEGSANGNLFDSFEYANYANNLISWHLRLKTPHNTGSQWVTGIRLYDENCVLKQTIETPLQTTISPFARYYSVRFDTPRHYALWNDETETQENCEWCEGTLPETLPDGSPVSFASFIARKSLATWSYIPSISTTPFPIQKTQDGFSSIAFIPGFQASRLYLDTDAAGEQLWEPTLSIENTGVKKLFLDESGKPLTDDIYTKDILDTLTLPILGTPYISVYQNFMTFLDERVAEGDMASWKAFPYDWRQSLDTVATGAIALPNSETYHMADAIEALAENSKTGKVTLITHSNGGLVGKLLINELERRGKENLIDSFILIGTPQLGTPKALAALLHGEDQEKLGGLILKKSVALELGKNMPSAYTLLPSATYLETITDPVVRFDESTITKVFRDAYGESIDTKEELSAFLRGDEGRNVSPKNTQEPIGANETLLNSAEILQNILDNWTPPEGIAVHQIIGWGLPTIKGIEYYEKQTYVCPNSIFSCHRVSYMDYRPLFTLDGDGTVVTPSADVLSEEKIFFDIDRLNDDTKTNFRHINMTDASPVLSTITSVIKNTSVTEDDYIKLNSSQNSQIANSLRISVHSPLTIGVTDSEGRYTGRIENTDTNSTTDISVEEIPNSTYIEFGEGKYLIVPKSTGYTINLDGYANGTFSLEIEELHGDMVIAQSAFLDVPVTPETKATLILGDILEESALAIDLDGNGTIDTETGVGIVGPPVVIIDLLRNTIAETPMHTALRNVLENRLAVFEKEIEKN